jgi:hypothetical protein
VLAVVRAEAAAAVLTAKVAAVVDAVLDNFFTVFAIFFPGDELS